MINRLRPSYWILGLFFLLALPASPVFAVEPVFTNFLGQAIRGYDPVAYFKEGQPVEGKSAFQTEWNGAKWRFATQENLDNFIKTPENYAPQYGGYCAYAVSQGATASIKPEAWSIVEGKLYLNYDKEVRYRWSQDIPGYIQDADKNWPDLLADNYKAR